MRTNPYLRSMKLSVIVPVYNVMSTLMRCVDSLVVQDVPELEIILVDDGSTDGSSALCDNIQRQYEDETCRIHVIHQPNGGLSAARNAGIAISTGELLTFVDSDDFIAQDTYGSLLPLFQADAEVDVVEFPVDRFYNVVVERNELNFPVATYDAPLAYLYKAEGVMHAYAWNKVFRRSIFPSAEVFAVGRTFEDVFALPLWLQHARKIMTTDRGCYFYTLNTNGICRTAGRQQHHDHFDALVALMQWIPQAERRGKAYATIYEQTLNVRKDHGDTLRIDSHLTPPLHHFGWRGFLKYLRYRCK